MAAAIHQVTWTDRAGDVRLIFNLDPQGVVMADLYKKNVQGAFVDTGVRINERNLTIETENLIALMRGIPQKSFTLNKLTVEQKAAILGSLQHRTIEVVMGVDQRGAAIIHAL